MSAPKLQLRPYQKEALISLLEVAKRAHKRARSEPNAPAERVLCVQPTGSGKTVEVIALVREVSERWQWRTLVIVPSIELVRQTATRVEQFLPGKKVGVIVGGKCQVEGYDLVVSTSASLHQRRLDKLPKDYFQLVVVDEAHHAAAKSFKSVLEHFANSRLLVGMTATYVRGDGVSVATPEYFSSVVVYHTIGQLTTAGYLAPADGFYKHTKLVLEGVPIRRGNLDESKLAHAVNTPERNMMAVDAWYEMALHRPTIVFCVNIDHAKDMAACFRARGVDAAAVWGAMDEREYAAVMKDYKSGRIKVLANARLLVEGFDAPHTSAIIIARPATAASAAVLGPQMIGRALRLHPESGKDSAVIIELMDEKILPGKNEPGAEKIQTGADIESLLGKAYGLEQKDVESGGGRLHDKTRKVRVEGAWRERKKIYENLKNVDAVIQSFNVIERIATVSQYAWIPLGDSTYYMGLAGGDFIEIVKETPTYYEVRAVLESREKKAQDDSEDSQESAEAKELKFIGSAPDWKQAIQIADSWLTMNGINHYYMHRDQPWRGKPPSKAQVHTAHKLTGLEEEFLSTLNRGQVSDLITSARALLLPVESITIADEVPVENSSKNTEFKSKTSTQAKTVFHTWQFQLNFS